jgi:hypothetical protein
LTELLPHSQCVPAGSLVKTNAVAKRVREALRGGVPANWLALVSGQALRPATKGAPSQTVRRAGQASESWRVCSAAKKCEGKITRKPSTLAL